jgi:hypothetical protein
VGVSGIVRGNASCELRREQRWCCEQCHELFFFSLGAKLEMRPHARLILQCNLRHAVRYVLQVHLVFEL